MTFILIFFGLWSAMLTTTTMMIITVLLIVFVAFPIAALSFYGYVVTIYKHI